MNGLELEEMVTDKKSRQKIDFINVEFKTRKFQIIIIFDYIENLCNERSHLYLMQDRL